MSMMTCYLPGSVYNLRCSFNEMSSVWIPNQEWMKILNLIWCTNWYWIHIIQVPLREPEEPAAKLEDWLDWTGHAINKWMDGFRIRPKMQGLDVKTCQAHRPEVKVKPKYAMLDHTNTQTPPTHLEKQPTQCRNLESQIQEFRDSEIWKFKLSEIPET